MAGLEREALRSARFLMVEETGTGPDFPFSGEKLSPVLTVYRARDFDHACAIVADIYAFQGAGTRSASTAPTTRTSCASASNCRCRA
jgi:sulfoacetaldehyde dehydrogenase